VYPAYLAGPLIFSWVGSGAPPNGCVVIPLTDAWDFRAWARSCVSWPPLSRECAGSGPGPRARPSFASVEFYLTIASGGCGLRRVLRSRVRLLTELTA